MYRIAYSAFYYLNKPEQILIIFAVNKINEERENAKNTFLSHNFRLHYSPMCFLNFVHIVR